MFIYNSVPYMMSVYDRFSYFGCLLAFFVHVSMLYLCPLTMCLHMAYGTNKVVLYLHSPEVRNYPGVTMVTPIFGYGVFAYSTARW